MKRALVTGITSYPGLSLAKRLLELNVEVHAVIREQTNLGRLEQLTGPIDINRHDGSVENLISTVGRVSPDVIFHLAGHYMASHGEGDIEGLLDSNICFGVRLLEAARCGGVRQFVSTGSYVQFFDRNEYRPLNLYAATKQAFQDVLAFYSDSGSFEATTLVLFDTYGEGDWRPRLMNAIRKAVRDGSPLNLPGEDVAIEVVHIDDVVAAYLRAAELLADNPGKVNGRIFAIRSDDVQTISGIVAAFEAVSGTRVKKAWGQYPLPERRMTDLWNGPTLPGWQCKVALEEGVRRFMEEEAG